MDRIFFSRIYRLEYKQGQNILNEFTQWVYQISTSRKHWLEVNGGIRKYTEESMLNKMLTCEVNSELYWSKLLWKRQNFCQFFRIKKSENHAYSQWTLGINCLELLLWMTKCPRDFKGQIIEAKLWRTKNVVMDNSKVMLDYYQFRWVEKIHNWTNQGFKGLIGHKLSVTIFHSWRGFIFNGMQSYSAKCTNEQGYAN